MICHVQSDKSVGIEKVGGLGAEQIRHIQSGVLEGGHSETSVEIRYEDENIWLTQKKMAVLYDVSVPAISI
jgi:hypothetical protein